MAAQSAPPSGELLSLPPTETTVVVEHKIRRLDWSLVGEATLGFVSMERGFGFTLRGFGLAPRRAFEAYLGESRLRFNNPLKLVAFLSALTAFLTYQLESWHLLHFEVDPRATAEAREQAAFIFRNYNLMMLGALPIVAGISRLFYRRRAYNFVEHLALNSFQLAISTAAYLAMLPFIILWPVTNLVYGALALGYQTWVYRQVLGPGWLRAATVTLTFTFVYLVTIFVVAVLATKFF